MIEHRWYGPDDAPFSRTDVNEELLVSRSQVEAAEKALAAAMAATTAPTHTTRPTSPPSPSTLEVPAPLPAETAADAVADAGSTLQRRTPSPESSPPSPSSSPQQPFLDPTPLAARIRRTSLIPSPPTSISPSKVSRPVTMRAEPFPSPPPPTGQTPFRAPLGRSTRTAHLQTYGLGRSPSSPALMASPSNRPHRGGGTRGTADLPRTDTATMIRDMQQMTSRVRMLTQRLDQRRSSVMRGSAIPRFGSPATATAATAMGSGTGGDESPTSRGSMSDFPPPRTMSRTSTLRSVGLNGTMAPPLPPALASSRPPQPPPAHRPPSRLGERDSTRPPSRSAVLRASIASSMAAAQARAPATTTASSASASSSRASSRLSIASSTATTSSLPITTRPLTPSNIGGPRSATPTNGYYPPATTSRAGSTAHPHPPRPSSSLGRAGLSKSVAAAAAGSTHASYGHARHASTALAASSMSTTLRSGRATPHQDEPASHDEDDRRRQLRSTMRRTSMGGTSGANRRASGIGIGLGLASSGNSSSAPLSKSLGGCGGGRRASLAASYGAGGGGGGREGPHGDHQHHHHHHRRTATRDEVPPVPPLPTASR